VADAGSMPDAKPRMILSLVANHLSLHAVKPKLLQRYNHIIISYHIISYHIVDLKWQNRLKVGTDKPMLKVKMQSVSDDDVWKRLSLKSHVTVTGR